MFFGHNNRVDQNARWTLSDRGKSEAMFCLFEGPALTGTSYVPRFTVVKGGNVGIGTITPQHELSVNGTIWAKEVKVTLTDAADWVFKTDYYLRPLEEVENFIKENKHLPDVPSSDEFRKNDMNLAEMNNVLLQKVEELTLYLIEQNKLSQTHLEKIKQLEIKVISLENK
jgi:hypothetical protein